MSLKKLWVLPVTFAALLAGGAVQIVQDQCGPFTDVSPAFCPYILELYYLGITAGTSATTFSPDDPLTRGQGAVFIAKGLNQALARSSRRAALGQWWTTRSSLALALTPVGTRPSGVASDGADLWVASIDGGTVSRVRASDGKLLETWTGATNATAVLVALGRIFVTGQTNPGKLYMIDPTQPAGAVVTVAADLGDTPISIAFDGSRIWTANYGGFSGSASVSIITPGAGIPWAATTLPSTYTGLRGILFDGHDVWVTSAGAGDLLRLDSGGSVVQVVFVDGNPNLPVFDGANIWVPNANSRVDIVRPTDGSIVASLTQPGLGYAIAAAFDGERIAVADYSSHSAFYWRAADLSPLGSVPLGTNASPLGLCSDGLNFWATLSDPGQLARF
jgi:DNA-binding beta-propeller fold protein YncE